MFDKQFSKIAIIGAGNVATHLGLALLKAGQQIHCIYNRDEERGRALASLFGARYINDLTLLNQHDLIILAVSDDAISVIANKLKKSSALVVHTSGTIPLSSLSVIGMNVGIFYPLQTFSKQHAVDFNTIPICVYSTTEEYCQSLFSLASKLSNSVHIINDDQRRKIHIAAVLVNNFSNYLYIKAFDFLSENNLPVQLIKPLIVETALKINDIPPFEAQTGPAKRGDMDTIAKHLDLIKNDKELNELYKMITDRILSMYHSGTTIKS
ncbi:MAG: DUF2520 domain-containing protein [Bacteroidetes bacterium]|nr:DUF2520 domain-containing protein [Bacteroidota bacterium]